MTVETDAYLKQGKVRQNIAWVQCSFTGVINLLETETDGKEE